MMGSGVDMRWTVEFAGEVEGEEARERRDIG